MDKIEENKSIPSVWSAMERATSSPNLLITHPLLESIISSAHT
jgi:hypothetical protein